MNKTPLEVAKLYVNKNIDIGPKNAALEKCSWLWGYRIYRTLVICEAKNFVTFAFDTGSSFSQLSSKDFYSRF